ncbi:DUF934 domain-containing protein [Leisingera caerulea]|uniref:DUF934 domain-containing protein n=1 Tax=Leisingera caerulea TaxID=506591 RepID=A0A9Q9M1F4_LEICA|nr:DUF934 domain-containing protein [Leisingera caerulea]UWQ48431.1 DUF934 domain-containing protein [Leisingera caerulea]UWQ52508.1 DUF934 domain-containing protein [Leisingera caerulea]UWQ82204.1 DUF934 domain-containing protein [Leisingera caerulea]
MSVIVTDTGFAPDDWTGGFDGANVLQLASDANLNEVSLDGVELVRVAFPSFADGRGFTLARQLRLKGYEGRLRAFGHVIADQYAMARRSGFDEVELSDELAARQPEDQWLARANWQDHSYQARLRGSTAAR